MRNILYAFSLALLTAFGILTTAASAAAANPQEGILVGRIAYTEGKLFRFIEDEKDWVLTVTDSPFGLEDALYSGDDAKAEFIMPNRTWLRIGENTQLQLIAMKPDATTVDVASGLARLYNKNRDAVIMVTTPFGYVVAPGDTIFDLYVGDESLEIIAVRGAVDFVHDSTGTKYEVREGYASIIAGKKETARGNGTVESSWDDWNGSRDNLWAERLRARGTSADLLPEPIREESYVLEENGRWERVYYEGVYRDMWRPTRVDRDWRPFTAGRWTVYYGDNCWIPDEPFGYVTHHYGSWVYVDSFRSWYWAPPIVRVAPAAPSFFISFGWYPGRVGWIHSGPSIGWVPLAPHEVYYGHRPWGHRTMVVQRTTVTTINIGRYRYLDEAVIIHRDNFYRGTRYTPHIQRNINRTVIINNYQPTTVINNTVINNFNTDKRRFFSNDENITRKPHSTVINRITVNQNLNRDTGRFNRDGIQKELRRVVAGNEPTTSAAVPAPVLTTRMVDADSVAKPIENVSPRRKEIKPKDRERRIARETDQAPGSAEQQERSRTPESPDPEDNRRMRSSRDARNEVMGPPVDESAASAEAQGRRPGLQDRAEQDQGTVEQKENKRVRSPGETRRQGTDQNVTPVAPPPENEGGGSRGQLQTDRRPETRDADGNQRLRSPRESRRQGIDRNTSEPSPPPNGAARKPSDQEQIDQAQKARDQGDRQRDRSTRESRSRQEIDQNSAETLPPPGDRGRKPRDQVQVDQTPEGNDQRNSRPVRSPRNSERLDKGQSPDLQTQEQDIQRQQQEKAQRQQEKELQRQQQAEGKRQQEQDVQRQQQEKAQRQQEKELQRQQQAEGKRRQEQDIQRQQQEKAQRQQEKELQRQQQAEGKRQQEQDVQRHQQEKAQRQQEKELQRQQQTEGKRRQEQDVQRHQQEKAQRQQEKELQRQQQTEGKRRQEQDVQRQQKKELQRQQPKENQETQEQQSPKQKKKKQTEEELLLEQQQGQPTQGQ